MSGRGHVYVVQVGALVKVGSSGNGRFNRPAQYVTGADPLLCWTSPAHDGYRGAERETIARLTKISPPVQGLEWFAVDFMTAVHIAEDATSNRELVAA